MGDSGGYIGGLPVGARVAGLVPGHVRGGLRKGLQGDTWLVCCSSLCFSLSRRRSIIFPPFCGNSAGFSFPLGELKAGDCLRLRSASAGSTLHVLRDTPQPQPSAVKAVNFPPIWPYPAAFTNGTTAVNVAVSGFKFSATTPSADLDAAFARFQTLFFPHPVSAPVAGGLVGVVVVVTDVTVDLQLGVDESYTLSVPVSGTITLHANTVYGAYHGLQTLSQLITFDFDAKAYVIAAAPWTVRRGAQRG